MTTRTYHYWPYHVPVPRGWVIASTTVLHAPHGDYSIIIRKQTLRERWAAFMARVRA